MNLENPMNVNIYCTPWVYSVNTTWTNWMKLDWIVSNIDQWYIKINGAQK